MFGLSPPAPASRRIPLYFAAHCAQSASSCGLNSRQNAQVWPFRAVAERRSEVKEEGRVWPGPGDMSEVVRPLT